MERWLTSKTRWWKVSIPFPYGYLERHEAKAVSSSVVLLHKQSHIHRLECAVLPAPNDFWLVDATNHSYRQLSLPTLNNDDDFLQVIHFDENLRILSVLLDDADSRGAVTFKKFRLDGDQLENFQFAFLEGSDDRRVVYRAPRECQFYRATQQEYQAYNEILSQISPHQSRLPLVSNGMEVDRAWKGPAIYTVRHCDGEVAGTLTVEHHCNHGVQAFSGDYILLPPENSGEDAFYDDMLLYNWRTKELVKTIKLPAGMNGYIETEWPRGLLPSSSTWFVLADCSFGRGARKTVVYFYGPEH
jgi:hypothetical protein